MSKKLKRECFQQGFERCIAKLASTAIKSAGDAPLTAAVKVLPAAAKALINPAELLELRGLGSKIYQGATQGANPIKALYNSALPAYGQLSRMKGLQSTLAGLDPADPAHAAITSHIAQQLAEIGHAARPRLRTMRNIGLGATAAAGGAAGYAGGTIMGHNSGESDTLQGMSQLPLMDRLRYLISPDKINPNRPQPGV